MKTDHSKRDSTGDVAKEEKGLEQLVHSKDQPGFAVPDGYFELLQEKIEDRVFHSVSSNPPRTVTHSHVWVWLAAAGILGFIAYFIFLSQESPRPLPQQFSQELQLKHKSIYPVSPDSLDTSGNRPINRVVGQLKATIAHGDSPIIETGTFRKSVDIKGDDLSNEEIIEYLLDEDIDLSDLTN